LSFAPSVMSESFPLDQVSERLKGLLITGSGEIDRVMDYLLQGDGKMLRPRLVYAIASMQEHNEEVVRDIAAALEMIHMASLVHDDIIDGADTRRNQPSLNCRYGNQISVLCGDYLFAAAFNLINLHNLSGVMADVTGTIQTMCSGEIKQMTSLYNLQISETEYYERIFSKTACLFACCCRSAAQAVKMPGETIRALSQYGLCLGFAYQIIDDVLDFVADSKVLGKPAANDLSTGNLTLPVILALQDEQAGERLRMLLQDHSGIRENMAEIMDILVETRALRESLATSRFFVQSARGALDDIPTGEGRDVLVGLSHYLLDGYYAQLSDVNDWREGTGTAN